MLIFFRFHQLMGKLTDAYQSTDSYDRKVKILGLSPYPVRKTMELFNASKYLVEKSFKLAKQHGILSELKKVSKGKVISKEIKEYVKNFYESDDVSRICPGKKDYISMWTEETGKKEHIQKRLVLMNLKEAYSLYKDNPNLPSIGFSTFASLRPKNCILAGQSGTHSVCVCIYHQNPKLQISALGMKNIDYKLLIEKSVCSTKNRNCMMNICPKCPGEESVKSFLNRLEPLTNREELIYKQWISTDRSTLIEVVESSEEFVFTLCQKIVKLKRHHFVAQVQSQFLKDLKTNINNEQVIVLGDFSENYTFIVQDAIQGFHYENIQCTIHPFVLYYKDLSNGELMHKSYCVLSPDTKHRTSMVYTFLCKLIPKIQEKLSIIKKIHYFTDGCVSQYKNKFNFINICNHLQDFGITCEWHFFATCHGKSACDGIGGIIKRAAAKASLQRATENQILSSEDLYLYCTQNLSKTMEFIYVSSETIKEMEENLLKERFRLAVTVAGTQKFHRFVPVNKTEIEVFELSDDAIGEKRNIIKKDIKSKDEGHVYPKIGDYVICSYTHSKWMGMILSYDEQFEDYEVDFLHPSGINDYYYFPKPVDRCHITIDNIHAIMDNPLLKPGTSRFQYSFSKPILQKYMSLTN